MNLMILLVWLVLGTVLFAFLHKVLEITYFGFSGLFGVWFGCMAAVAIVFVLAVNLLGSLITSVIGFVVAHYKVILGGVAALVSLYIWANKSGSTVEKVGNKQ